MRLNLNFNNFTNFKSLDRGFFNDIIKKTFDQFELGSGKLILSLNLVTSKKMGEINKKYRGKNQTTDVLSFSYAENQLVSQSKLFAAIKKENLFELGDIFIDPMVAKRQAKKSEHSLKKELATLTVHGVLHLLGYDHERSKKDEKRMYGFQEKVLMKL